MTPFADSKRLHQRFCESNILLANKLNEVKNSELSKTCNNMTDLQMYLKS
jgi:hypothetical protein